MKMLRTLALVVVAAIVVGAIGASAAQATEGPFLKVGGVRLSGSEQIEGKGGTYVLTAGTIKVTCTSQVLETGAHITGSLGANAGTGEEAIKFSGCTVVGNGVSEKESAGECKVVKGTITTETVKHALAFPNETSKKGEVILVLFQPTARGFFANIKFEGLCKLAATAVDGSVAAEALEGKEKSVKVEEEAAEAEKAFINFPASAITRVWVESSGARFATSVGLNAFGKASTLTGRSEIKPWFKSIWGIFTK